MELPASVVKNQLSCVQLPWRRSRTDGLVCPPRARVRRLLAHALPDSVHDEEERARGELEHRAELIVLVILLCGFGTSFFVLYKEEFRANYGYSTMSRSEIIDANFSDPPMFPNVSGTAMSLYVLMLGDWSLEKFLYAKEAGS